MKECGAGTDFSSLVCFRGKKKRERERGRKKSTKLSRSARTQSFHSTVLLRLRGTTLCAPARRRRDTRPQRCGTRSARGETGAGHRASGATRAEGPWRRETTGGRSRTPENPELDTLFGGSALHFPTLRARRAAQPRDRLCLGVGSRSPAAAHAARTTPGSGKASAKVPRGTEITPVSSAARSLLQSRESTLPPPQHRAGCPHPRRDAGSSRRACGAPGAASPAPLVRPASTALRARPRGAPPGPLGETALAACSFRTRAARPIPAPCRDRLWSPVRKEILKSKGPRGGFLGRDRTSLRHSRTCSGLAPPYSTETQIFSRRGGRSERKGEQEDAVLT